MAGLLLNWHNRATLVSNCCGRSPDNVTIGERGIYTGNVEGDVISGDVKETIIIAESGATVYAGEAPPPEMSAVDRESTLGKYLSHIIARNRYLQLQGIRSGGRLVHISLIPLGKMNDCDLFGILSLTAINNASS